MCFGLGDVDELPSLKEFEALARAALGADDGIAAELEGGETGEQATPGLTSDPAPEANVAPNANASSAAGEVSAEAPPAAPAPDSESRDVQSRGADAAEKPGQTADRAAKQAAPGRSE